MRLVAFKTQMAAWLLLAALPAIAQSRRGAPSGPPGQLDANPTLFAVLAAANAAGYDAEIDSPTNLSLIHI